MIFIGSDHGGWNLKQELIKWFKEKKIQFADLGPEVLKQDDDFPEYALAVAKKVAADKKAWGILIDRSGLGMSIAANKIKGIRAALCTAGGQTITARAHLNCNVLVIAADLVDIQKAKKFIDVFLQANFSQEERYVRRLKKIEEAER